MVKKNFDCLTIDIKNSLLQRSTIVPADPNDRRALAKYPEVARVESQAVCRCTVCRQDFLQTSFEFADLVPHWDGKALVNDFVRREALAS